MNCFPGRDRNSPRDRLAGARSRANWTPAAVLALAGAFFTLAAVAPLAAESRGSKPAVPAGERVPARVVRVVDGNTLRVSFASGVQTDVRLIGMLTPERLKPNPECGARAAAASLMHLALGRRVLLATDPTLGRFDKGGDLQAYVYVEGKNLNLAQILRGWGRPHAVDGHIFEQFFMFQRASGIARREDRGIWKLCGDIFS